MPPRESDSPRHRRPPDGGDYSDPDYMGYTEGSADDTTQEFPPADDPLTEDELSGLHYDASGVPFGQRRGPAQSVQEQPSAFVAHYLFPTEKFRGEWRKHWSYLFDWFSYGALATFAFGWLWGYLQKHHIGGFGVVVVVLWIIVMTWVGYKIADWYFDRFILTNKRIMQVSGMVSRTVAMMPLLRVTDMKYEQSPMGRLLSYGTFVLESAGQEQALRTVRHLPNPNELYLRIVEEMYEPEAVEAKLAAQAADAASDDGA
jgi:membrane protein YdbS with pleckstrin-like domain